MSQSSEYEIRYLTTDDLEQYNALLRYAFQITEQELYQCGWQDEEIKQSKFPCVAISGLSAEDECLWCRVPHRFRHQRLHISRIYGTGHNEAAYAEKPSPYAPKAAVLGAPVPVFHPAIPKNGLGNSFKQNNLLSKG